MSGSPFRHVAFRALWTAALLANIGMWMQSVGSVWLMVSLGSSPLLVALAQTAISAPAFLLGLPAGVLGDLLDRRRLLLGIHAWMLLCGIALLILVRFDAVTPWALLGLAFLLGSGAALGLPIVQSSISDTVPRATLLPAIGLQGIAYNAARAIGPALAGILIARAGVVAVLSLNIVLLAAALGILAFRYAPTPSAPPPPQRLRDAVAEGLQFMRHARELHGYLWRAGAFMLSSSALWALLPLSRSSLGAGQGGYGYLLGSLGAGSIIGGLLLRRVRILCPRLDPLLAMAGLVLAASMLVVARAASLPLVCATLVVGGIAWICFTASLNASFQSALPPWVRARAIAVFLLAFQGAMAVGALAWGFAANRLGVANSLELAAGLMVAGLLTATAAVLANRRK